MFSALWEKVKPPKEFIFGWAIGSKVGVAVYIASEAVLKVAVLKYPLVFKVGGYVLNAVAVFGKKVMVAAVAAVGLS